MNDTTDTILKLSSEKEELQQKIKDLENMIITKDSKYVNLVSRFNSLRKRFNRESLESIPEEQWIPSVGQTYWHIGPKFSVKSSTYTESDSDIDRIRAGQYWEHEYMAKAMIENILDKTEEYFKQEEAWQTLWELSDGPVGYTRVYVGLRGKPSELNHYKEDPLGFDSCMFFLPLPAFSTIEKAQEAAEKAGVQDIANYMQNLIWPEKS